MVKDIFEQYKAAFRSVGAYVLLDSNGTHVATIAFKLPEDGANTFYCYLDIIGVHMIRGAAKDKAGAALEDAIEKIIPFVRSSQVPEILAIDHNLTAIKKTLPYMEYRRWDTAIERAGFRVLQAI